MESLDAFSLVLMWDTVWTEEYDLGEVKILK